MKRKWIKDYLSFKIVVTYSVFATLWIIFSDYLLAFMEGNGLLHTLKGLGFVLTTSLLLYSLINHSNKKMRYANEEMTKREERFYLANQVGKTAIWEWDIENNNFYMDRVSELLGYEQGEIGNCLVDWQRYIHPHDFEEFSEKINLALDNKIFDFEVDYRIKLKEGQYKWFSSRGQTIVDSSGKVIGLIGAYSDIDERKKNFQKMIEQKRTYQTLMETLPDGLVIVQDYKISFANSQAIEIIGKKTLKEVMGIPVQSLVAPSFYEEGKRRIQNLMEGTQKSRNTVRSQLIRSNGDIIDVEVKATATQMNNKKSIILVVRDITDRIKIEKKLQEANMELTTTINILKEAQSKMVHQEKLAGIGQLAAGIAHEINNPLGFITSNFNTLEKYQQKLLDLLNKYQSFNMELANQNIYDGLKKNITEIESFRIENNISFVLEDLKELMKETNDGISRVEKIVKSMRMFSRIDKHQEREEYDLNAGIRNTLIVANNEIKYDAKVKKELGNLPLIKAIGSEINQVFLNLLINAIHAIQEKNSEADGLIVIRTYSNEDHVYCEIRDNGVGIEDRYLNSIFNPFFTTKQVGKGTGLGLSISYDIIVNQHKGDILVKSEKGKGTAFTIKLPIHSL